MFVTHTLIKEGQQMADVAAASDEKQLRIIIHNSLRDVAAKHGASQCGASVNTTLQDILEQTITAVQKLALTRAFTNGRLTVNTDDIAFGISKVTEIPSAAFGL